MVRQIIFPNNYSIGLVGKISGASAKSVMLNNSAMSESIFGLLTNFEEEGIDQTSLIKSDGTR
ncbi:hypothetical protein A8B75_14085 [Sphingomonadales bacterium EhC05]|jgi:hypothetical protein|nr:hypothetical protein A8B75_14085 [Sphingomonadales bacterium EhC05]